MGGGCWGSVLFVFSDTLQRSHELTGVARGWASGGKWLSVARVLVVVGWGGREAEGSLIIA